MWQNAEFLNVLQLVKIVTNGL